MILEEILRPFAQNTDELAATGKSLTISQSVSPLQSLAGGVRNRRANMNNMIARRKHST